MTAAFDAPRFVAELRDAGLTVGILRDVPRGGVAAGPPTYFVRSQEGRGLGSQSGYDDVMARWRGVMAEHPDHVGVVAAFLAGERPAAFDPAAFVADLRAAGCHVVLSAPGTCFRLGDERATYFIAPADGQGFGDACSDVMLKWHEARAGHPDPDGAVVAHLTAAWEAGA